MMDAFSEEINAKQTLFFILLKSGERVIPRYCDYIPNRNREKQLCNKAIKSHKKPFLKRVRTRNTATLLVNRPKNSFISEI
jgi:hypothetical protein